MKSRLSRFATMNPGFEQCQTQLHRALADPDVIEELRMAANVRMSEAGMLKATRANGQEEERARMLAFIEKGYTLEQIKNILRAEQGNQ